MIWPKQPLSLLLPRDGCVWCHLFRNTSIEKQAMHDQETCEQLERKMTTGENLPAEYEGSLAPAIHRWL